MVNSELLKGSLTTLILTVLNRKEMYGYDIIKEMQKLSSGELIVKEGSLYPLLHSLEREGAVESYWVEKADIRKRKYYRITKVGRKLLKSRSQEWQIFKNLIDRVLADASMSLGGA